MNGLDDVIAADTVLSDVDGHAGTLVIRGHSLDDLAGRSTYEDVLALLWDGLFEDAPDRLALPALLGEARMDAYAYVVRADAQWIRRDPVEALRVLLARMEDGEDLATALRLVAGTAVFTAAVLRLRRSLDPTAPDPRARHSADLLRMFYGESPTPAQTAALDRYLV